MKRDSYRHFLRMRVASDEIKVFPIALDKVPRRHEWRESPGRPANPGTTVFVPPENFPGPRLIEGPVIIRTGDCTSTEAVRRLAKPALRLRSGYSWLKACILVALCSAVLAPVAASTAELGAIFTTYDEMHLQSPYGALFFAEGSTQSQEILINPRFVTVIGDGELALPQQSGYCFVLNHYSRELGFQNILRPYQGIITKLNGEKVLKKDAVKRRIIPTANEASVEVADICMDGISGVSKIAIEFGMYKTNGRVISFGLK